MNLKHRVRAVSKMQNRSNVASLHRHTGTRAHSPFAALGSSSSQSATVAPCTARVCTVQTPCIRTSIVLVSGTFGTLEPHQSQEGKKNRPRRLLSACVRACVRARACVRGVWIERGGRSERKIYISTNESRNTHRMMLPARLVT